MWCEGVCVCVCVCVCVIVCGAKVVFTLLLRARACVHRPLFILHDVYITAVARTPTH